MPELVGFWSYARNDDAHSDGQLSQLRAIVGKAIALQYGGDITLWQDIAAIPYGADWAATIERTIGQTTFFVPIITPRFLKSENCHSEFMAFRRRMAALGRDDLIFPILYVSVEHIDAADTAFRDDLPALHRQQAIDFRPLVYADPKSSEVRKWAGSLASSILKVSEQVLAVEKRKVADRMTAASKAAAMQAASDAKKAAAEEQIRQEESKRAADQAAAKVAAEPLVERSRSEAEPKIAPPIEKAAAAQMSVWGGSSPTTGNQPSGVPTESPKMTNDRQIIIFSAIVLVALILGAFLDMGGMPPSAPVASDPNNMAPSANAAATAALTASADAVDAADVPASAENRAAYSFNSVYFLSDRLTGWLVGDHGTIFHTGDGGKVWNEQRSRTAGDLMRIRFAADGSVGVAVGQNVVLMTEDGGHTWKKQMYPGLDSTVWQDVALDGPRAWIVGPGGQILNTKDGGRSWQLQKSGVTTDLNGVDFAAGGMTGWIVGDHGLILVTSDGGEHWSTSTSGTDSKLNKVHFDADGRSGLAVGDDRTSLKSTDGGLSWTRHQVGRSQVPLDVTDISVAADGKRAWILADGVMFLSTDGGRSWASSNVDPASNELVLHFYFMPDGRKGWGVGFDRTIVATEDGGQHWQKQAAP